MQNVPAYSYEGGALFAFGGYVGVGLVSSGWLIVVYQIILTTKISWLPKQDTLHIWKRRSLKCSPILKGTQLTHSKLNLIKVRMAPLGLCIAVTGQSPNVIRIKKRSRVNNLLHSCIIILL